MRYHHGTEMGFGDIVNLAESLGWVDPNFLPWTSEAADKTEQSALEHIAKCGIEIVEEQA